MAVSETAAGFAVTSRFLIWVTSISFVIIVYSPTLFFIFFSSRVSIQSAADRNGNELARCLGSLRQ